MNDEEKIELSTLSREAIEDGIKKLLDALGKDGMTHELALNTIAYTASVMQRDALYGSRS